MKYVVLAADRHPDYQFLLPMSAILWSRMGFKPLILSKNTKCARLAADFSSGILKSGDEYLDFSLPIKNDRLWTKLSRWFSFHYVEREDHLLLMDIDCWPMSLEFWSRPVTKGGICFYADAFKGKRQSALGFMASAEIFRVLATLPTGCPKLSSVWEYSRQFSDERRHSDDALMGTLAANYVNENPDSFELVDRGPSPPADRIDRNAWPDTFSLDGKVDAHLPRDASDGRVWAMILPLFDRIAPDWSGWVRAYRRDWEEEYQ